MKKFIIGLGTGRCGTSSLSCLLSAQSHIIVPHEYKSPLPWKVSTKQIEERLKDLRFLNGDIGYYYLSYIKMIMKKFPQTKFVCLQRDRQKTINSFLKWTINRNHWINHDGTKWNKDPKWDPTFPKFECADKNKVLGKYYDHYYSEAHKVELKYPSSFKVFPTDYLNTTKGVKQVLSFCQIRGDHVNLITNVRANQSQATEESV